MAPIEVPMIQSGSIASFVQRLIDAGLIGAERAAALEHQDDLARRLRRLLGLHGRHVLNRLAVRRCRDIEHLVHLVLQ